MADPVAEGYDAVYAAWSSAATFHEIWARHAVDGRVAPGFEHISFVPVARLGAAALIEPRRPGCTVAVSFLVGTPRLGPTVRTVARAGSTPLLSPPRGG